VIGESFRSEIAEWMRKWDAYLVVFEEADGENPHVHAIIHTVQTIKQVRNAFTYKFKSHSGNACYSIKKCDDDFEAYIRYMCKGANKDTEPVVIAKCGLKYDDQVIKDGHAQYWVNNAALVINRKKEAKMEKLKPVELVEKESKRLGLKGHDREGIAKVYIRLWRDARKPINLYAARAVVNTVSVLLDGHTGAEEDLARKISEL